MAIEAASRLAEDGGWNSRARFDQALILAQMGRPHIAMEIVAALDEGAVDAAQKYHLLGTCAMELGRFEEACAYFERVLVRVPTAGQTWHALTSITKRHQLAGLKNRMTAISGRIPDSADVRAPFLYALGTVHDAEKRYEEAFGAFCKGANLVAPLRPYSEASDRGQAERLMAENDGVGLRHRASPVSDETPVFIVGHPRSGTTLLARLLARATGIRDGGELNIMRLVARDAGGVTGNHAAGQEGALCARYLSLGHDAIGTDTRFIDKSLNNGRYMGLIRAIFPTAPVIWMRRQLIDTGWSCFRTYFSVGVPWSWSLASIATHLRIEEALMRHWSAVLGDRMTIIDHRELVEAPDAVVDMIAKTYGLAPAAPPEEEQVIIRTASVAQVRESIDPKSIGAAQPYLPWLGPLKALTLAQ